MNGTEPFLGRETLKFRRLNRGKRRLVLVSSENIPVEEIRRLSAKAMEENIHILQALADHDRADFKRPWKHGVFVLDPRTELKATIGTISGFIQLATQPLNAPKAFFQVAHVEKAQSVGT